MQIESILRAVLEADPAVSVLAGTRIYQTVLPREPVFPAVAYQMVSRVQDGLTGIVQARIQYTCMDAAWVRAADLADAVRCALHGYRVTRDGARIENIQYAGQTSGHDPDTGSFWIPVDVIVTYFEV